MIYLMTWLALGLGILADVLFYKQMPGLSVPVFTAVFLAVVWVADRRAHKRLGVQAALWSVGALATASMFALRVNEGVLALNALLCGVLTLCILAAAYGVSLQVVTPFAPVRWLVETVPSAWVEALGQWKRWLPGWQVNARVWRAVSWSVALGFLFFVLLFSADPAFREFVARLISTEALRKAIEHTVIVGLLGGAFLVVLTAIGQAKAQQETAAPSHEGGADYSLEWLSVLGTSNAVFALFLFARFFERAEMGRVVYAYAAREGFLSLVTAVAVVAGMLWARRFFRASMYMPWQQALETTFVVQTIVVLAGSVSRLNDYIGVYGLTYPRLAAWVCMFLLGLWVIALLVSSISERVKATHVWQVVLTSITVATVAVTIANPEALVVRYTLARSAELTVQDMRELSYQIGVDGYSDEFFGRALGFELTCSTKRAENDRASSSVNDIVTETGKKRYQDAVRRYCDTGVEDLQQSVLHRVARYRAADWRSFNTSFFATMQSMCGHDSLPCGEEVQTTNGCGPDNIYCIE